MNKITISGGIPLRGTVKISGAKNAALPILAATLLAKGQSCLRDIPRLADVETACEVLKRFGAEITRKEMGEFIINADNLSGWEAPYELVGKMRASFLVMGPLLARLGKAKVSLPGGCAIGTRPIDLHLKGFEALGAKVILGYGYIEAFAEELKGNKIYLDFPSVGATENIMMAAVLAKGKTIIENAATEPEVVDLAKFLNSMGAKIIGAGTGVIRIEGVEELTGCEYKIIPDRVEAGTYMVAAAITNGDIWLENVISAHVKPVSAKLREVGVQVLEEENRIRVFRHDRLYPIRLKTMPYPGFPTDMQAQFMSLLTLAEGTSIITETVFENRFMHVAEMKRMGANIFIEGRNAIVQGVKKLTAAPVKATDLRAGAALVLAGLCTEGETEIGFIHHIERGYENLVEKLQELGAQIKKVEYEEGA